ncbi:MAG: hypothetical protein QM714_08390 [Nocardioides sp.]
MPIEVPVTGSIQSTQSAYSSGVSERSATTSPEESVSVNSASAVPPSK